MHLADKFFFICVIGVMGAPLVHADPSAVSAVDPARGPVYAFISEQPVYAAEIAERINELPIAQRQQLTAQPGGLQTFVDNLLTEKMITAAAAGLRLESTDTYARKLRAAGDKILRELYMELLVGQVAQPTAAEIDAYYRLHLAEFTRPSTIRMMFVLVGDVASANRIYREAKGGASFEALQATWSTTTDSITILQTENLPAEMQSQLAALPSDGVFMPYVTAKGVYVFKRLSTSPMQIMPLDEVRDSVRQAAHREKIQQFWSAFLETLKRDHPIRVVGSINQPVGGQ